MTVEEFRLKFFKLYEDWTDGLSTDEYEKQCKQLCREFIGMEKPNILSDEWYNYVNVYDIKKWFE